MCPEGITNCFRVGVWYVDRLPRISGRCSGWLDDVKDQIPPRLRHAEVTHSQGPPSSTFETPPSNTDSTLIFLSQDPGSKLKSLSILLSLPGHKGVCKVMVTHLLQKRWLPLNSGRKKPPLHSGPLIDNVPRLSAPCNRLWPRGSPLSFSIFLVLKCIAPNRSPGWFPRNLKASVSPPPPPPRAPPPPCASLLTQWLHCRQVSSTLSWVVHPGWRH